MSNLAYQQTQSKYNSTIQSVNAYTHQPLSYHTRHGLIRTPGATETPGSSDTGPQGRSPAERRRQHSQHGPEMGLKQRSQGSPDAAPTEGQGPGQGSDTTLPPCVDPAIPAPASTDPTAHQNLKSFRRPEPLQPCPGSTAEHLN